MAKTARRDEDADAAEETATLSAPAAGKKHTASVTYIPRDGDPVRVKFAGIEFKAHMPIQVPLTHGISAPLRKETVLADGTIQTRNVETKISVVELCRGNPSFIVDGEQAQRVVGTQRMPADNDQYRGYAIAWIAGSNDPIVMDTRWNAEADLRERCGVDENDLAYLRPFFESMYAQAGGTVRAVPIPDVVG